MAGATLAPPPTRFAGTSDPGVENAVPAVPAQSPPRLMATPDLVNFPNGIYDSPALTLASDHRRDESIFMRIRLFRGSFEPPELSVVAARLRVERGGLDAAESRA